GQHLDRERRLRGGRGRPRRECGCGGRRPRGRRRGGQIRGWRGGDRPRGGRYARRGGGDLGHRRGRLLGRSLRWRAGWLDGRAAPTEPEPGAERQGTEDDPAPQPETRHSSASLRPRALKGPEGTPASRGGAYERRAASMSNPISVLASSNSPRAALAIASAAGTRTISIASSSSAASTSGSSSVARKRCRY